MKIQGWIKEKYSVVKCQIYIFFITIVTLYNIFGSKIEYFCVYISEIWFYKIVNNSVIYTNTNNFIFEMFKNLAAFFRIISKTENNPTFTITYPYSTFYILSIIAS